MREIGESRRSAHESLPELIMDAAAIMLV